MGERSVSTTLPLKTNPTKFFPACAARRLRTLGASWALACAGLCLGSVAMGADVNAAQLEEILRQNRQLQEQVRAQQATIEALGAQLGNVVRASERQERELRGLAERVDGGNGGGGGGGSGSVERGGAVRVSAEAGLAYFRTERGGQFPEGAFRADDPTLAIEAPVLKDIYWFAELKLLPRETNAEDFELGELYVDFENVLERWAPGLLNVRVGRLNIPFGEEYAVRGPIANPLISHSLSDLWGVDEGVEAYGRVGAVNYVVAVQNGGVSRLKDFHRDKSVTARVGWQPAKWLQVSGSAMRTGKISSAGDSLTELWFGNGFFRALGGAATTATFWANLYQGDATVRWKSGRASAALGIARFDDDDTGADNARRITYGYVEATQDLAERLFAAARYSEIRAPRGYPLVGWAPMGAYFFRPTALTEELRRMSVGLGYRFGPPLVLKVEYTWENGRMTTGARRDQEDFFGTQLGVRF